MYADIVGNGSDSLRSNAFALDWDGNGYYAGDVYANVERGIKEKASPEKKLVTKGELPSLKWLTVHSSTLTESKNEIIVSTDADGKPIADYHPLAISLILSTPADDTEESSNGSPWVYPSSTKFDNAIRAIGNISGWKTVARDSVFMFHGGGSAIVCTGNVSQMCAAYKVNGYTMDGVRAFLNNANDHFPVGTHVEAAILCEV